MPHTRILALCLCTAVMVVGAAEAHAQDAARVFSNREVAPPACGCVTSSAATGWPLGTGFPWLRPRLGMQVEPGVWLGMDMPPGAFGPAPVDPAAFWATRADSGPGGLSLEITPPDAELWVDEALAGPAADFGAQGRALPLPPGIHRIELRAAGFVPLVFDILTTPGYVLPWRGSLRPDR